MKDMLYKKIVVVFFMIMIILPIINFNTEEGKTSQVENKTLQSFPNIFSDGKINLSFPALLVNWFEDNLGFRDSAIELRRAIVSNIYNQSPNNFVENGKDGWLYYTCDNNMQLASGKYPNFTSIEIKKIVTKLDEINKDLKNKNISFVFMSPPSKTSVYPEYIKSGEYSVGLSACDNILDYINRNTDIYTVDLKRQLVLNKTKEKNLYYKKDTHWNHFGRYIGYTTIINELNAFGLINNECIQVEWRENLHSGDLSRMISDNVQEECYTYKAIDSAITELQNDEKYNDLLSKYRFSGSHFINNNIKDKTVLIFGDSMINNITSLLAENFKELYFVRSYEINKEIINYVNPDIVILDVSERYLNVMLNSINSY